MKKLRLSNFGHAQKFVFPLLIAHYLLSTPCLNFVYKNLDN
jgi:hypothetical protein